MMTLRIPVLEFEGIQSQQRRSITWLHHLPYAGDMYGDGGIQTAPQTVRDRVPPSPPGKRQARGERHDLRFYLDVFVWTRVCKQRDQAET